MREFFLEKGFFIHKRKFHCSQLTQFYAFDSIVPHMKESLTLCLFQDY